MNLKCLGVFKVTQTGIPRLLDTEILIDTNPMTCLFTSKKHKKFIDINSIFLCVPL